MPVPLMIVNPYSGRGAAGRRRAELEGALTRSGLACESVETSGPRHAEVLAEQATAAGRTIIIAGGDGTIGEVVNGMARAQPEGVLGPIVVLPLGTANDLVHNLGLPLPLEPAAAAIVAGRTRRIDLGQANEWVFANNSAVGLEPVVTQYNIRMVRWRGLLRYLVAALRAINDKPAWSMRLTWDDGSYEGPISLVSVGNGAVTGGLFRMAPAALPDDGRLTFVFGFAPTRRKMLGLLPRTISGSFVDDPAIQQHHMTRLDLESAAPTPIQLDGEIRDEAIRRVTYRVQPARLDIFRP
ncbi:MAG TPA: diacylglycerol kinase family protein [Anaerolineales bacterium]|nr:diacylglycerol kinase family protein [Anaerolineales bacterium]